MSSYLSIYLTPPFSHQSSLISSSEFPFAIMSKNETTSLVWTDEKHVHFLNTIEDSFVTTMLYRYRLDRHLPDTSDSTLDSKPSPPTNINKHSLSPSDSMVPRVRRTRRRSSQPQNYFSQEQVVPQLENGREVDACVVGDNDKELRSNVCCASS